MVRNVSWLKRYELTLKDYVSIKDIQILINCGQPGAIQIRSKAVKYCEDNNIGYPGKMAPIEAVFAVTGKDRDYYYNMMIAESKSLKV